jgi:plastocyanin
LQSARRLDILNIAARLSAPIALALLLAGCGSGTASSSGATRVAGSTPPAGRTVKIVMRSLAFNPPVVYGKVGQTVTWNNEDSASHNVTYVSGPRFRSSRSRLRPGSAFSLILHQPGTIHYFCSIHPWMTATIAVSP